jgi:uncharacterized protein
VAAARTITLETARRLAVSKQLLARPRPPATADGILEAVERLGRLQLDPTSVVARSHLLVLWSRLGAYDSADLTRLLEEERSLFEYRAFIVPTAHFALYRPQMRSFPRGDAKRLRDTREWMRANDGLRRSVLGQLRRRGPLRLRDFQDRAVVGWQTSGWNDERNVGQMLDFLLAQGKVLVTRREGGQRVWDLAERVLPADVLRQKTPSLRETELLRVERELRVRGVAGPRELLWAANAPRPAQASLKLARAGRAVEVAIEGLPGERFVHVDDLPLLDQIERGEWEPRTTLLSPFDTLIHDRERTEELFDFRFRLEIYVPKAQREYGYFVLPILHGDRLIGRADPEYDRKRRVLTIKALHWEPKAPAGGKKAARTAIAELADWLGAERVEYATGRSAP